MDLAAEIEDVLENAFGADLVPRDELEAYVETDLATVLGAVVRADEPPDLRRVAGDLEPDEAIVGVSIARGFDEPAALSAHPYVHADPADLLSRIGLTRDDFPVGSVLLTAVAAEYRGQGIGREISVAAAERLVERGTTPIVQFEWDRPDSPAVETLREAGYTPRARLEDHFPSDWTCEACESGADDGRCTCDVVVFLL